MKALFLAAVWGCILVETKAAQCGSAKALHVDTASSVSTFTEAVACEGGSFSVTWDGDFQLEKTVTVGAGTSLNITGVGRLAGAKGDGTQLFVLNSDSSVDVVGVDFRDGTAENGGIFHVGTGASLNLKNCALSNGLARDSGGAVAVESGGSFFADTVSFINCSATLNGGFISANGGLIDLTGAIMRNGSTSVSRGFGGAIFVGIDSNLTMQGGEVTNCTSFVGGGIATTTGSRLRVLTTTFNTNYAVQLGGGIFGGDATAEIFISAITSLGCVANDYGGAMMLQVPFVVEDSIFIGNIVGTGGGAIASFPTTPSLIGRTAVVRRSQFASNYAIVGSGGAIAWGAAVDKSIEDCVFEDNFAVSGGAFYSLNAVGGTGPNTYHPISRSNFSRNIGSRDGGAISSYGGVEILLDDCRFESNVAKDGSGGAANIHEYSWLRATHTVFLANSAGGVGGGAVAVAGNATVSFCRFIQNSARTGTNGGIGGGLYASRAASVTLIDNTKFLANVASTGGALEIAGYVTASASRFMGNRATLFGGAIYLESTSSPFVATSIVYNNTAGRAGAGVFSASMLAPVLSETTFSEGAASCCHAAAVAVGSYGCADVDWAAGVDPSLEECCSDGFYGIANTCPACPDGFACDGLGLRYETLVLEQGLWRPSLEEISDVRTCWRKKSCQGGAPSEVDGYCAPGYSGPYCAVCQAGFARGLHYKCNACDNTAKAGAIASIVIALVAIIILLLCAFYELWDVGSVSDAMQATGFRWGMAQLMRLPWNKLRIPLVVFQVLTTWLSVTGLVVPDLYMNFLSVLSVFSLDLSFLGMDCLIDIDFYRKLLVTTLLPPVFALLLLATFVMVRRNAVRKAAAAAAASKALPEAAAPSPKHVSDGFGDEDGAGNGNGSDEQKSAGQAPAFELPAAQPPTQAAALFNAEGAPEKESAAQPPAVATATDTIQAAASKHSAAFMLLLFILYSSLSTVVFQTFACDSIPELGGSYLRADYRIQCHDSKHRKYSAYAAVMIVLYPIGIPLWYSYLLWRDRKAILEFGDASRDVQMTSPELRATYFLRGPYRTERYYWEVVECMRRLLLTGFLVFIMPGTPGQAAVACVFAVGSLFFFAVFWPHRDPNDAYMYSIGAVIIFLSMFMALMIATDVSTDAQSQEVFSILLIVLNVALIVGALAQCFLIMRYLTTREEASVYGIRNPKRDAVPGSLTGSSEDVEVDGIDATGSGSQRPRACYSFGRKKLGPAALRCIESQSSRAIARGAPAQARGREDTPDNYNELQETSGGCGGSGDLEAGGGSGDLEAGEEEKKEPLNTCNLLDGHFSAKTWIVLACSDLEWAYRENKGKGLP